MRLKIEKQYNRLTRVKINIQKNSFLDPHVSLVASLRSIRYFLKNLHSFWIFAHCATRATSMIKIMWHRMRTKISFFEANSHDKSFLYKCIQQTTSYKNIQVNFRYSAELPDRWSQSAINQTLMEVSLSETTFFRLLIQFCPFTTTFHNLGKLSQFFIRIYFWKNPHYYAKELAKI